MQRAQATPALCAIPSGWVQHRQILNLRIKFYFKYVWDFNFWENMPGKNVWGFIKHLENNLKTFFQTLNDSSLNPNWYLITMYSGTFSVSFYSCKRLRRPLRWEFLPVQVGITSDTIWPVSPHHFKTAFSYRNTCPKSTINLSQNQILGRFQTYLFIMNLLLSEHQLRARFCL